ncbi:MAG: exosortase-associated EpsI family protein [Verrucomicrobiia bacterium]
MTEMGEPEKKTGSVTVPPGKWRVGTAVFACFVLVLWLFPRVWYTQKDADKGFIWLTGQTSLPGWEFKPLPVAESAERLLAADETISGQFTNLTDGRVVQVFLAKRYTEKPHDIGLFVHTPDRCWTEAGWRLDPVAPDHVEVDVHGARITFERRVFVYKDRRELVLFGGLVGGQPLPYRLDHNLSVGMRSALQRAVKQTGAKLRASDRLLWQRVWESFVSRRQLFGPKMFVRISTRLESDDTRAADELLVRMLSEWLRSVDFAEDMRNWKEHRSKSGTAAIEGFLRTGEFRRNGGLDMPCGPAGEVSGLETAGLWNCSVNHTV